MMTVHFCSNAQLHNRVLGLTVGSSSKQDVKSRFFNEGEFTDDDDILIFHPQKQIYFGSYYWDEIYFAFFKNTLLTISLQINNDASRYYDLLSGALSKYHHYRKEGGTNQTNYVIYEDGKTKIMCYILTRDYRQYLRLSYTDLRLFNQKENYGMDDL